MSRHATFCYTTQESNYKHTVKSVLCCLRKAEGGKPWPRLTKDKAKVNVLPNNNDLVRSQRAPLARMDVCTMKLHRTVRCL